MEDYSQYQAPEKKPRRVQPLNDPDFIGAEVALKRASEKAIARACAAGLEPVIAPVHKTQNKR